MTLVMNHLPLMCKILQVSKIDPLFHLFLLPVPFISLILIQFFNMLAPVHTEYQPQQKQLEKLPYQHYQRILLYHQLQKSIPQQILHFRQTPIKTIPEHTTNSPSDISSFTFSQLYPKLERPKSTTTSSLTDLYHNDIDSDSTASTRVPRHSYYLRCQPRRLSQELSSLTSSSTNSRLVRQQAQPRSDTPSFLISSLYHLLYHYHFK